MNEKLKLLTDKNETVSILSSEIQNIKSYL